MNEVNVLKKFRNVDVNGMCKETDDGFVNEIIKVFN